MADRVSVNLELRPGRAWPCWRGQEPGGGGGTMRQVSSLIVTNRAERKKSRKVSRFAPPARAPS
ncbi:hypothetical protein [Geotalea toluenoxydans]|uniref:hypothetical protein n=1 Tax=Geotalea toluenoxydans TaxID=421624 RepID=UPI000ACFBCE0|nr:hypothetical protein [Geotalea toluenoxydans]